MALQRLVGNAAVAEMLGERRPVPEPAAEAPSGESARAAPVEEPDGGALGTIATGAAGALSGALG
ncbi:MAG: hypothetical protein ACRDK0_06115, partial [Solirubrobacteraceae bacterium]